MTSEEVSKAAIEMRKHFFVPFDVGSRLRPIEEIAGRVPPQFKQPIDAFCSAVNAIHATLSLPYLLATSRASALHFQRFHMAERIRNLPSLYDPPETPPTEEERDRLAYESAKAQFLRFGESEDGTNALVSDIATTLLGALEDASTANAATELLRQALVSLWSALEVLTRDILTIMLNSSPQLSEGLLSDPSARKYFDLPKVSIEELSLSGYDLSGRMGDLLFGSRDFSDLRAIKAGALPVLGCPALAEALGDNLLWVLNQERHLIVHRRGVVDAQYIEATGTRCQVGEVITVSPTKLEKYFGVVVKCAASLLSSLDEAQAPANSASESAA